MDDLIKRQDAIRAVTTRDGCGRCEKVIKNIPSAQKKGHWIDKEICFTCSECSHDSIEGGNFCPNCGADMRET